jgi:hypothetical protein
MESGLWVSYKKKRDPSYPDGAFQGADLEYWGMPRDEELLKKVIAYREMADKLLETGAEDQGE